MLWAVPIVVALIGGPLMWFLHRFDRRNSEQHNHNFEVLGRIEDKIDKVDEKYDKKYDAILLLGLAQLGLVVVTLITLLIKH